MPGQWNGPTSKRRRPCSDPGIFYRIAYQISVRSTMMMMPLLGCHMK